MTAKEPFVLDTDLEPIMTRHPRLFANRRAIRRFLDPYSWTPPGWTRRIDALFTEIEQTFSDEKLWNFRLLQVKEKLGGLRVYVRFHHGNEDDNERLYDLVNVAENDCYAICCHCGEKAEFGPAPGRSMSYPVCPFHLAKAKAEYAKEEDE